MNVLETPGHLVSVAARWFARLSEARLKPLGFGVGTVPVLVALDAGWATTQTDLARLMRVEQPSMAQMLSRMERDGLVRRVRDPNDARSRRIVLTEAAAADLSQAREALFQGNREALDGFSEQEVLMLSTLLERLIDNLARLTNDADGGSPAAPQETGVREQTD